MIGWLIIGIILAVVALVALLSRTANTPIRLRKGWWRLPPPNVMPLQQGTARNLWSVVRLASNYREGGKFARSFNFNSKTGAYQLYEDWLVNWEVPAADSTSKDGPRMTGALETVDTETCPHQCPQKTRLEMIHHHGLDPDGKIHPSRLSTHSGTKKLYKDAALAKVASGAAGTPSWKSLLKKNGNLGTVPPGSAALGSVDSADGADAEIDGVLRVKPHAFVGVNKDGSLQQAEPLGNHPPDHEESAMWLQLFPNTDSCDWSKEIQQVIKIKDVYKPSDVKYSTGNVCKSL